MKDLSELFNKGPVVVLQWKNAFGRQLEEATENVKELTGYAQDEFLSGAVSYADIIHPADRKRVENEVFRSRDSSEDRFSHTPYRIVAKDGSVRWVNDHALVSRNAGGEVDGFISYVSDITEQRKNDKSFGVVQKWKALIEGRDSPINIITTDYRVVAANQVLLDRIKKREEDVVGRLCYEVYQRRSEPCEICAPRIAMETKKINSVEKTLPGADGALYYFLTTAYPVFTEDGDILQIAEITTEITDIRRAEKKLWELSAEQRILLDALPAMVFWIDLEGRFVRVNQSFARALNVSSEEIQGKSLFDFYPEEMAARFHRDNREVVESGLPKLNIVEVVETPGGAIWVKTDKLPIPDFEGNVRGIIGLSMDITEVKKAERLVLEEKERLLATIRSIGDGVITTDNAGHVGLMNGVAEFLTGWSQEEAAGKSLSDVFVIIDTDSRKRAADPVETALNRKSTVALGESIVLISRKGVEYYVAASAAPIISQGELRGGVLVFRDITEKLNGEEELLKAKKLESVGLLAGGIAHDFNNILTGLFGNIELAKMSLPGDHKACRYIESANRSLERAIHLSKQLLTFAKGGEPVLEDVRIADTIQDIVSFNLSGSNVRTEIALPDDLWPLKADKGQIGQVFANLVINARQAMPIGGTIFIEGENLDSIVDETLPHLKGKFVRITVRDEGVGMSGSLIDRIFDPYFTTKQEGSGLGLATVHSIVQKHHGHISVSSRPGEGTAFRIYLPAEGQTEPLKNDVICGEYAMDNLLKMGRVLVMDDEEMVREVVGAMLEALGHHVEYASDGGEALQMYRQALSDKPFSFVLLDLTIPGGMGGKETAEKLRAIDPEVRMIVYSGYSEDPVVAHFADYGFCGRLLKPFKLEELKKVVQQLG